MMKRTLLFLALTILPLLAMTAQELPQFAPNNFDGWYYNNPNTPLSMSSIGNSKIILYVNTQGKALMLTSPAFTCTGIDSIAATVTWRTLNFYNSSFKIDKASLTMVIDDESGQPLDSVTCTPTTPGVSTHTLFLKMAVPQALATARLRFASWTGDVVSNGAVQKIILEAITTQGGNVLPGDTNGNGMLDISDVTELIDYLLGGTNSNVDPDAADVDRDGRIDINDVSTLIDLLLSN